MGNARQLPTQVFQPTPKTAVSRARMSMPGRARTASRSQTPSTAFDPYKGMDSWSGRAQAPNGSTYTGPVSTTYAYGNGQWGHTPQRPGAASPIPPKPQGSPYGQPQVNYYPGQEPSANARPRSGGTSAFGQPPSSTSYGDPRGGLATQSPANRPPPFQVQAQTPWGQSNDPFAQRDAFIGQLNQQRIQRAQDFNSAGFPQGSPWLNYGQAAQQAGVFSPQPEDGLISRLNQQFGGGWMF